jgi:hypothetical protein
MNALDQLNAYLGRLEGRLRFLAVSKGASLVTVSALLVTVFLVWIVNRYAFSSGSVLAARVLLFVSVATAVAFGLVIPLLNLNRRNAARRAERTFPDFQERLLTLAEKPDAAGPFVELLASDTMRVAENSQPHRLAPTGPILGFLTSAGFAVAVLLWLILAGPGYLGYGTSLLWAGAPKSGKHAFYDISVSPGDRTVRRKSDQVVTALLQGFEASKVRLFAQYRGTSKWEPLDMLPSPGANTYEFLFSGLPNDVEYYVEAGAVTSKHYTLRVIDLPAIKKIKVTYHYPSWTGMKDSVEDPGGDLRAVEGTEAEVAIQTDRPLAKGVLMLGDDRQIELKGGEGNWLTARVPIDKDGMYHVAANEQGENVRMTEDFFIEARKDSAPTVSISRPGRDVKVNPIEEVSVTVQGGDDFGLNELSLHYSVNGAPEKIVSLLGQKGVKTAEGKYMIALEDYKLSPGDLVTIYATAKDARNTTKTDMYFIQAEPFERNYSQSQEAGGGGDMQGGDDPTGQISQRQKDIIAATWNELKNAAKNSGAIDDAKFLAEQEDKLAGQAKSLAERMKARELSEANSQFKSFTADMEEAAKAMQESAQKIRAQKWNDSLAPEQQALQHALRAEATFRDIQVAFGSRGGGGGGGSMGRDLENLADLELDREKNQYETGRQSASDSRAKEIDQALQKLQELAKRQQELAQQQKDQQQAFRQRWEQEMLRREAEELKRQMEQLSRGDSSQQSSDPSQQSQGQQSSSGQAGQSGKSGQSGKPGSSGQSGSTGDPRLQRAIEQLSRAADDMRNAENPQASGSEQANAQQRIAAQRLQEARDILNGMQHENASQQLDDLAQQAAQLAQQESETQTRLRQALSSGQPGQSQQQVGKLADEKDKMAEQLKQVQKKMADTARSMAGAQDPVANKLREALSEAQQKELEMNMRRNAQWLRQGYGMQVWVRENSVAAGLSELRDKLQQAQGMMTQGGQQQGKGPGDDKGDYEKALSQLEAIRNRMQQMAQARGNQPGGQRQGDQGRPGQNGQPSQNGQPGQSGQSGQPGSQPGQKGSGQQAGGQAGGQQDGQANGAGQVGGTAQGGTGYGPLGGPGPAYPSNGRFDGLAPLPPLEQGYRESLRDLNQLRDFVRTHPELSNDYMQLMHALNPVAQNDAELSGRIGREVLPEMERLELEMRTKLDEKNADQVRSAGSESIPQGYSDAIADYFRKLSKSK